MTSVVNSIKKSFILKITLLKVWLYLFQDIFIIFILITSVPHFHYKKNMSRIFLFYFLIVLFSSHLLITPSLLNLWRFILFYFDNGLFIKLENIY
jgi:hypothetical protein